jgi:hypothetical protein
MEVKTQINSIKELSNYMEKVTWKQSDEFYHNSFNLIKEYDNNINRLDYAHLDECCWQMIKHINFYKLEDVCKILYEYLLNNDNKVSKCFKNQLTEEYYYDADELFGGGSSNFIFERFFKYSIKAKNFVIVSQMINCDNEEYILNNIDLFVKNNQLEVIEDFILEIDTYNFKEIFEKLLQYKDKKIDAFAINVYRKYNEL